MNLLQVCASIYGFNLVSFFFVSALQRDTNGLSVENNELKLRVQSMEQQFHLQDGEYLFSKKKILYYFVVSSHISVLTLFWQL